MNIYKFYISTYHFGTFTYVLYVAAPTQAMAENVVLSHERYARDLDAEIIKVEQVDLTNEESRII